LLGEAFFVLYGDSYLVCDYQRIQRSFERAAKPALMTVCIENNSPNACYANGRVLLYDKRRADLRMHHIDYGLGIWLRETILNSTEDDLADTYHRLAAIHCLAGYEWPVRYVSIGNTEGLKAAEKLLATPPASGLHQQASDDGSSRSDEPPQ
jgi:hypothetical protein